MNNELILNQETLGVMVDQAKILLKSGFLPASIKTPEQAITIMIKGKELGVPPMEALSSINVIQGKPTIAPQLMLALARRTRELEDLKIEYDNSGTCHVTIKRKGQTPHSEKFGDTEARSMNLAGKDNYKKQAKNMYKWRALSANLRVTFPDIVSGLYTHEELAPDIDYNAEGEPLQNFKIVEKPEVNELRQPKKLIIPDASPVISEAQLKRLLTIQSNLKITDKDLKPLIEDFGYKSRKLIHKKDYDKIIEKMQAFGKFLSERIK